MAEHDEEISLIELAQTLVSKWRIIVLMTAFGFFLAAGGSWYFAQESKEAQLILSFRFQGIENAQNPDGKPFDPYQVVSPFVLTDAIQQLKLEKQLTASKIRELVSMEPIIPDEILKQQKFALEKQGETVKYYPTEYVMVLRSDRGNGVSPELAERLANQIVASYINYFAREYYKADLATNALLAFNPKSYDYADVSMVIHQQLANLQGFNQKLGNADPEFRSSRTGLTFNDILQSVDVLDTVDVNRLDSLISSYKLTRDVNKLILYYTYLIDKLELTKSKLDSETIASRAMLGTMENSKNQILTALITEAEAVKNESKSSYFNSLILKTASVGTSANAIDKDIAYYKNELAEIQSGMFQIQGSDSSVVKDAEALIGSIIPALNRWTEISNSTSQEYYEKIMTTSVVALSPAETVTSVKMPMNAAIGAVLGLMLGIFGVLVQSAWVKENKQHA